MSTRRTFIKALGGLALLGPAVARAQAPAVPVRVGYVPVIGASALFVLEGAGWAKEAGLDIRTTKFDSGPNAIQALASGTLDVLAIGVAPIAVARAKGIDVKVVAAGARAARASSRRRRSPTRSRRAPPRRRPSRPSGRAMAGRPSSRPCPPAACPPSRSIIGCRRWRRSTRPT